MLYVFHGTDIVKGKDKAVALIDSLRKKRPDASYIRIDSDNWSSDLILENIGGQGLFSNKYIIFLDRVVENKIAKEEIVEFIPAMKDSTNVFILFEGKVSAELKKAFDKNAEKVVVSELPTSAKASVGKEEFNIFALGDAIGSRDRFKSWSIYRQAIESGLESESIIGTLFWQIKSIILSANSASATEAGMNPFVFGKSKRYASNYSKEELSNLLKKLTVIYHDGHRGLVNTELAIERLMLGL